MKLRSAVNLAAVCTCALLGLNSCSETTKASEDFTQGEVIAKADSSKSAKIVAIDKSSRIDTLLYDSLVKKLANGDTTGKWPVKKVGYPYPLSGAILPFKRVVAYYGNLFSKKMGILGELPPKEMLAKLDEEVKRWNQADPSTPVQPALHYIAVVAQGSEGKDGKFRYRMPEKQIDSVLTIAKNIDAIVFLDIQVALSNIREELPLLDKYLKMPNVHLGIDPEFSMKGGEKPGTKIGTFDADDINFCSKHLSDLVTENNLPPKIFIIHRFTRKMVTNADKIKLLPEVQVVMNMDGWGQPDLKKGTYRHFIHSEPVQFTGFKLFYKNDLKKEPNRMLSPDELLKLKPQPIYIQYQ